VAVTIASNGVSQRSVSTQEFQWIATRDVSARAALKDVAVKVASDDVTNGCV
jgi:hypothetical protein